MWCSNIVAGVVCATAALAAPGAQANGPLVNPANLEVLSCEPPSAAFRILSASAPGGLYLPGESAELRLRFDQRPQGQAAIVLQPIHTQVLDKTAVHVDPYGHADRLQLDGEPVEQPLAAATQGTFDLELELPEWYGTYAVMLRDASGQRLLGTVARVLAPRPDVGFDDVAILGSGNFIEGGDPDERAAIYARMGLRGYRAKLAWHAALDGDDPAPSRYKWDQVDARLSAAQAHGLKEIVLVSPRALTPFGKPTPAAVGPDWDGNPYWGQADWNCAPEHYPAFGRFIEAFCRRYWRDGQGAVWGLENYNEPWEGGGISGWARDALQYRAIQKTIHAAARQVSPDIRLLAASSIMNTEDKFYTEGAGPDGSYEMDRYFDVFSDHYVNPASSYGPMVAKAHGKLSIDDESWIAISQYMLAQTVAQYLAAGQRHVLPFDRRAIYQEVAGHGIMPTTLPPAIAAMNRMLAGHRFNRVLFHEHLPWAFQFGQPDDPEAVVLLFGRLITPRAGSMEERAEERLWRQVDNAPGGTLTIDNRDSQLRFFDLSGNRIHREEPRVQIPMTVTGIYIQSDAGPALVEERLRSAVIEDKRPVELVPLDLTLAADSEESFLEVSVRNRLNRRVEGTLLVSTSDAITLKDREAAVSLEGGESRRVRFPISDLKRQSAGFPISLRFDSEAGDASHAELLHITSVPYGKKEIDGDLSDWVRAHAVVLSAGDDELSPSERARRPWLGRHQSDPGDRTAEFFASWDEQYLYFAARVYDPQPQMDKLRQATRDDDRFFHDASSDQREPYKSWLAENAPGRSFAEVPYIYDEKPFDQAWSGQRLHIGLNVRDDWHDLSPTTDRVPYGFHAVPDTDYEFSLYLCEDGESELWRLLSPGLPRTHDFPRTPRGALSTGVVPEARHVVRQEGAIRIYEAAIPRSAIPDLRLAPDQTFRMTFEIGVSEGRILFGAGKAATRHQSLSLHPYWNTSPSNDIVWRLDQPNTNGR